MMAKGVNMHADKKVSRNEWMDGWMDGWIDRPMQARSSMSLVYFHDIGSIFKLD